MSAPKLLARAFHEDPFITWAEPNPTRRAATMERSFAGMLRFAERVGGHLYEEGLGSVHWRDGRSAHMGNWQILTSGTWRVALVTPPEVWLRLARHEAAAMERVTPLLGERSAYLCTLGIEPTQTGRGHGGRLLSRALAQMSERWSHCVLRTEQPKNLPFYQRAGFRLADEAVVELSGLRVWVFERTL